VTSERIIVAEVEEITNFSVVGAKVVSNFTVDVIGFNEVVSEDTFIGFRVLSVEIAGLSVDGAEYKICSITVSLIFVVVVDGVVNIVSDVTSICFMCSIVISFS